MDHESWVRRLYVSYKNEHFPSVLTNCEASVSEVDIEITLFRSHSNFKDKWLEYHPPLLERQFAFQSEQTCLCNSKSSP